MWVIDPANITMVTGRFFTIVVATISTGVIVHSQLQMLSSCFLVKAGSDSESATHFGAY